MREGVTKFRAQHLTRELAPRVLERASELLAWRRLLFELGMVGQDPQRYGGAGYGNLSVRIGAPSAARGRRGFVITGTQTGGIPDLGREHLAVVHSYDAHENSVDSSGPARPSSESMTHGAFYDLTPSLACVFHVHCPVMWRAARQLHVPTTADGVDYGTPEMAREVERLARRGPLWERGVLAMGGHEDGIVAFGRSCDEAGSRLLTQYARALRTTIWNDDGARTRRGIE